MRRWWWACASSTVAWEALYGWDTATSSHASWGAGGSVARQRRARLRRRELRARRPRANAWFQVNGSLALALARALSPAYVAMRGRHGNCTSSERAPADPLAKFGSRRAAGGVACTSLELPASFHGW
jgi:hypothetical protein